MVDTTCSTWQRRNKKPSAVNRSAAVCVNAERPIVIGLSERCLCVGWERLILLAVNNQMFIGYG